MNDNYEITQAIREFLIEKGDLVSKQYISKSIGMVRNYLGMGKSNEIKSISEDSLSKLLPLLRSIGFTYNKENIPIESFSNSTTEKTISELTIDEIFDITLKYFNVPRVMAESKTRKREIVQVRQVAMKLSKDNTRSSLATIGMNIGDKDHSTVLHACKTIGNLLETDKRFKIQYQEIELCLNIKKKAI